MTTRRSFLKTSSAAGLAASAFGFPSILHAQNKGDKLKIAMIGVGGINGSHAGMIKGAGDIVMAYCDVDTSKFGNYEANKADPNWKDAKGFQDYRKMFDEVGKTFDAVMIGTPDHHHYPATALAMSAGKHCYTQKPLTHTVWEAREIQKAAESKKLVTQMGNHGHANEGNRRIYEFVNSGMLGDITEIHCVSNRPIWPQGGPRPTGEDAIPAGMDWDLWIGPAPMRPFKKDVYHPFNWRGFLDFGGGALADMACHTMDSIFMSMNPGYPEAVEVIEVNGQSDDMFPTGCILRWTFGPGKLPNGKDRPGFIVYWYDGKLKNEKGEDALALERVAKAIGEEKLRMPDGSLQKIPTSGNVYVGTKESLLVTGDYGDRSRIIPEVNMQKLGSPPKMLERSIGHYQEWREACLGNKPLDFPGSNFKYAAPFTETIHLGNVAQRVPAGKKLLWDAKAMAFTNSPEANAFITKKYRAGWEFKIS
jgi:predicted dehydrogenase